MNLIRIALAEDQTMILQGLVRLLSDYSDIQIVATARNGKELLKQIKCKDVDLVLLDEEMPEMDGRQTLSVLSKFYPTVRVILLTVRESLYNLQRLIMSGAKTVINKSEDVGILVDAIRQVFQNGYFYNGNLTPDFLERVLDSPEIKSNVIMGDSLSRREMEIIGLICQGRSNGEISLELSLSQRTIENHRQRISKKTGCKTIAELVVFAIQNGVYEI